MEIAGQREGVYVMEVIDGPGAMTAELDRPLRVIDTAAPPHRAWTRISQRPNARRGEPQVLDGDAPREARPSAGTRRKPNAGAIVKIPTTTM